MPGLVLRNWRLKLVALLLAIAAWVGVVYAANPPGQRAVQVPVPQPAALPGGYVLTSPIPNLTVVVAGTQDHLSSFNAGFLEVSADYAVIGRVGDRVPATVGVPVQINNTDPNVQLVNPPDFVQADVDKTGTATASVEVAIQKNPPAGYQVVSTKAAPSIVTLDGPKHELAGAVVKTDAIDLSNQEGDYSQTLNIYAYDRTGRTRLNDVSITPASVTVSITIQGVSSTRTSALVLGPLRGLASGYQVTAISYLPTSVTLTGPQNVLNLSTFSSVSTGAIDLGFRTGTSVYIVPIPAPATNVTVTPTTVRVTVTVSPIPKPTPAPTPTPTPTPTPAPTP